MSGPATIRNADSPWITYAYPTRREALQVLDRHLGGSEPFPLYVVDADGFVSSIFGNELEAHVVDGDEGALAWLDDVAEVELDAPSVKINGVSYASGTAALNVNGVRVLVSVVAYR